MSIGTTFAIVWLAFTAGTILAVIPILVWAVKSGQFKDRDHARYLPLLCSGREPAPPDAAAGKEPTHVLP